MWLCLLCYAMLAIYSSGNKSDFILATRKLLSFPVQKGLRCPQSHHKASQKQQ